MRASFFAIAAARFFAPAPLAPGAAPHGVPAKPSLAAQLRGRSLRSTKMPAEAMKHSEASALPAVVMFETTLMGTQHLENGEVHVHFKGI